MAAIRKPLPTLLKKENIAAFLSKYDTFMFDCDGVLWAGDTILDRANLVINHLKKLGKNVFLVTNNSTKSTETYKQKCDKLSFNVKKEEILGASRILASYMKKINFQGVVYTIGSKGIEEELDNVGIKSFGYGPEHMESEDMFALANNMVLKPEVNAVVVGFDPYFSLPKLLKASSYIYRNKDCLFLATNTDECIPMPDVGVFPGTGSMVRAVETVVGRPATVMGKPHPRAFEIIQNECACDPARTIMVGDRLNTDILLGSNCGISSLLVLTGVHTMEDVSYRSESGDPELHKQVPDYYLPSLGTILDLI